MSDWAGLRVVVAGIGISGFAAADALLERGAQVVVIDPREGRSQRERGIVLDTLGADILLGQDAAQRLPEVTGQAPQLLVVSPGWDAGHPVVEAAIAAGADVWAEPELAWRMRPAQDAAPWLTVTGSRGKATTTTMLAAMLRAAGHRATATGQAGTSLLESVLHPQPYDVLAVQLSGFQLRWSPSVQPQSALCLNVLGADLAAARRSARGRIYHDAEIACVYNVADPVTEELVLEADVIEGCRAIGFTLGVPAVSMLGLVEDVLCDRAFVPERITSAAELGTLDDVRLAGGGLLAPHNIANALGAAALARGFGVPPAAVRDGLRGYAPLPHRLNLVAGSAEPHEVTWVNDSAATDPVAAGAGLAAFEKVVWVAGGGPVDADGSPEDADPAGQLADPAGQQTEELDALVARHASRLRAVVLLGPRGGLLREALQRHAPDVPVVDVTVADTGPMPVMEVVVVRAGQLARPGDAVLLSPAFDAAPFSSLDERGAAFASAVRGRSEAAGAGPAV